MNKDPKNVNRKTQMTTQLDLSNASYLNIKTNHGNNFSFNFQVTDFTGSAYDLTGHNASMYAKVNDFDDDEDAIYSFTTGSGLLMSGSYITLSADATTMSNEDSGSGYFHYTLTIEYPSGDIKNWIAGRFVVTPNAS